MRNTSSISSVIDVTRQKPFERIVPLLKAALLLGVGGGVGQLVLTLTRALSTGTWWLALGQANRDLLFYGWAGLLLIGIVFHFLPRLCGTPLPAPWLVSWIVAAQVAASLMRMVSQPVVTINGGLIWRILLLLSGVLECAALITTTVLFVLLLWRGMLQVMKPTLRSMLPFLVCAFISLALAGLVSLTNMVQAALGMGLVQGEGDSLGVGLGLFGFLIPLLLALSIRLLPLYVGVGKFPQQLVWPLAATYFVGLALTCIGVSWAPFLVWLSIAGGLGMVLLSVVLLAFVAMFVYLARPFARLRWLGAQPDALSQSAVSTDQTETSGERSSYGPFINVIISAYFWVMVSAFLLASRGVAIFMGVSPFFTWDSVQHSFTNGFIALLLAGIAVRILSGFAGRSIAGPVWVSVLLWFGNMVALLNVGLVLLLPVFISMGNSGHALYAFLLGLSGFVGLGFAVCLLGVLWPVLRRAEVE